MIRGVTCPKEKGQISLEECLACAVTAKNKCHYTSAMIRAIMEGIEERTPYHVTMLINCLRSVYFEQTHDLYPPIQNLYYFFRGRAFHSSLEHNEYDYQHEIKVKQTIELYRIEHEQEEGSRPPLEIELRGGIDEINFKTGLIRDYKSCQSVPKYPNAYTGHILQLNIYLYLLQLDKRWKFGWEPQVFEIVYLDMGISKRCKVKVMDYAVLDMLIKNSLLILESSLSVNIAPLKQSKDLWQCEYCGAKEICEKEYIKEIKAGKYDTE